MRSIDESPTNNDKLSRNNEGKYFLIGFLTLKCAYWAQTIRNAIKKDGIVANSGYHIETINKVDNDIFIAPTVFLIMSGRPYCLNSLIMLSNLKTHTIIIDTAIIILDKINSIFI